jgi:hypothetical protein
MTKICAVCCARERMIELACPESCQYLSDARAQVSEREGRLRRGDETFALAARGNDERSLPVHVTIEDAIVKAHRGIDGDAVRDLKNAEILESIENAIKNLQTEESGLIYEHHSSSTRVEEVSRRIRAALDELAGKIPAEFRPRRGELIKILNVERAAVELHIRRGEEEDSYLRHISLFLPWPKEKTHPLII